MRRMGWLVCLVFVGICWILWGLYLIFGPLVLVDSQLILPQHLWDDPTVIRGRWEPAPGGPSDGFVRDGILRSRFFDVKFREWVRYAEGGEGIAEAPHNPTQDYITRQCDSGAMLAMYTNHQVVFRLGNVLAMSAGLIAAQATLVGMLWFYGRRRNGETGKGVRMIF
jgi:hypothetical protein